MAVQTYAVVRDSDSICVNLILWDSTDQPGYTPGTGLTCVAQTTPPLAIGDTYTP